MNRLDALIDAAVAGGKILHDTRGKKLKIHDKGGQVGAHFATDADITSQDAILDRLALYFPRLPVNAEEQAEEKELPALRIDVDPSDGTTNHTNGCDENGVILAYLENHEPVAGVIYLPFPNVLLTAEKGRGCYIGTPENPREQKVSLAGRTYPPLDKCLLAADFGPWMAAYSSRTPRNPVLYGVIKPLFEKGFAFRGMMCSAQGIYDHLMGRTLAYLNLGIAKTWDLSAGALMVTEAGGFAVTPDGKNLRFDTMNADIVFAANQAALDVVLPITTFWQYSNS